MPATHKRTRTAHTRMHTDAACGTQGMKSCRPSRARVTPPAPASPCTPRAHIRAPRLAHRCKRELQEASTQLASRKSELELLEGVGAELQDKQAQLSAVSVQLSTCQVRWGGAQLLQHF